MIDTDHSVCQTKPMPPTEQTWLTPEEAAKEHGVSAITARRWAREGRVTAKRTPGGQWRILSTTTTEGSQP